MSSLAMHLRQSTAAAHRLIEAKAIPAEPWTREGVQRLLCGWSRALRGYAPLLDADAALTDAWGPHRLKLRAEAALQDVQSFETKPLLVWAPRLSCATAEARWGAAYVLEGSAMGGMVLARRIAALQMHSRFYSEPTDVVTARWTHFRLELDRFGAKRETSWEATVDAARQTFAELSEVLAASGRVLPSAQAHSELGGYYGPNPNH